MIGIRTIAALTAAVGIASCTYAVHVEPGSTNVRVVDASLVSRFALIGEITSSVMHRIGIIARDPAQVEEDLAQIARNSAVSMKGDSIVPGDRPRPGERQFTVYRCLK